MADRSSGQSKVEQGTSGKLELPCCLADVVAFKNWDRCKNWDWWLSPGSPVEPPSGTRLRYAEWLSSKKEVAEGKGLYIWLYKGEAEGERTYRFLHVGLSAKGRSNLAARTKTHCRNQMGTTDPLYSISYDRNSEGRGRLVRQNDPPQDAKWEFLRRIRVMFLFAPAKACPEAIRALEGWIAYAARFAFADLATHPDGSIKDDCVEGAPRGTKLWTTNTLQATSRPDVHKPYVALEKLRDALNQCVPMLPDTR